MDSEREPEKKMEDRSTRHLRKFCLHACSVAQSHVILWTVSCQVPLSVGFSRQEYCSGLPFSLSGDLPNPGTEPGSPTLQADSLPAKLPGKPPSTAWWSYFEKGLPIG